MERKSSLRRGFFYLLQMVGRTFYVCVCIIEIGKIMKNSKEQSQLFEVGEREHLPTRSIYYYYYYYYFYATI